VIARTRPPLCQTRTCEGSCGRRAQDSGMAPQPVEGPDESDELSGLAKAKNWLIAIVEGILDIF
jgi:hypothetical protein